jgi:4-aminobutyrate aminotransferase-like enzyme/Ser/Thr protein kinase RdoA (MazF antagonist)
MTGVMCQRIIMSILTHAPQLSPAEASRLARDHYGLSAMAAPLPSERDQNFLLTTEGAERYVLKIANSLEDRTLLEAQQAAMAAVVAAGGRCPTVLFTLAGKTLGETQSTTGDRHLFWLISHLPGRPLGEVPWHSPRLLRDLGRAVGDVDRALIDFEHPALRRVFHWDLAQAVPQIRGGMAVVPDARLRALMERFLGSFEERAAPSFPRLRRGVIHNDANDFNVIVAEDDDPFARHGQVNGLVDFGDMVHSYMVADPAVAVAYAMLDKADPLAAAAAVVAGYHAAFPLTEIELSVLFDLACLRLCLSVCHAATQSQQRPGDPYLAISQEPIRRTLPRLLATPPRLATAVLRHACGLEPAPGSRAIVDWLTDHPAAFAPVLGHATDLASAQVFDLSPTSSLLQGPPETNPEPELTGRLFAAMESAGATVGVGRYDEPRLIYSAPMFANGDGPAAEWRTIHLGIDLFAPGGTTIHAPLAGTVFALADNASSQDYGPVVLLHHKPQDGPSFYTLYGHLSRSSLTSLTPGQTIAAGDPFATLGAPAENGGWPPHLHFQLVVDLLDLGTDFPGVGPASQRAVWRSLSPDPNLIVRIPESRFPTPVRAREATRAARRARLGPSLSLAYREPVQIVRGWMQYLYDETGRRYLDAYNNVPHVGHAHPRIVEAACRQMAILNTNTRYLHDLLPALAERLSATLPAPLRVCFFLNSASEANELALRLARAYTGQRDMIVLEAAYHGHTTGLIDISPYKHDGPGGQGAPAWVHVAPLPDTFRGRYRRDHPDPGARYARDVAAIIDRLQAEGAGLAGFIAESLPSVGGQIVLPDGYLDAVYRAVRAASGVCIADDVQTGYGRIGTHFYGFEQQEVVPDIVVLGKPIGNGHPLAAVVTTPPIAEAFDNGMEFFSTFGGNTVSCAVGLAVLEVLHEEGLQAHARRVGERLLAGLRPLRERHPLVGDVRGSGLFLGVELVRDRETLLPAGREAAYVANRMRDLGILLGTDGPDHNVVKIRPPMPFSETDADRLVEAMDQVLAELRR